MSNPTINAAAVSRTLGKRFVRSTTERSRVRGLPNVYRGFTARQAGNMVEIGYEYGYAPWSVDRDERHLRALDAMAMHLVEQGLSVEPLVWANGRIMTFLAGKA